MLKWAVSIILSANIASAEERLFEITGSRFDGCGFYVSVPGSDYYRRLSTPHDNGPQWYLFKQSTQEWRLSAQERGFNRQVQEGYKAIGKDNVPPENGWTAVSSTKAQKEVWRVEDKKTTVASNLKEIESKGGTITLDGKTLCLNNAQSENKWILLAREDERMCNSLPECKNKWDEDCLNHDIRAPKVLVSGGNSRIQGSYELKKTKSGVGLYYSRVDGPGFIRWWRRNGGEWIIAGPQNGAVRKIYSVPGKKGEIPPSGWKDIKGRAVTAFSVSSASHNVKERTGQHQVVSCEGRNGKLLDLDWSDEKVCDGISWECKMGRDERFCNYHSYLTDTIIVGLDKIGSDLISTTSGIYEIQRHESHKLGYYKHINGESYIYPSEGKWIIGKGTAVKSSSSIYESGISEQIPLSKWRSVTEKSENNLDSS